VDCCAGGAGWVFFGSAGWEGVLVGFEMRRKVVGVFWVLGGGWTGRTEGIRHAAGVAVCFNEVAALDVWLEV
jgi:hypothetical protein